GPLDDRAPKVLTQLAFPRDVLDETKCGILVESPQVDHLDLVQPRNRGGVPGGGDDQNRAGASLCQTPHQGYGRRIGPMEVFQDHEMRFGGTESAHPADDPVEGLVAEGARLELRSWMIRGFDPQERSQEGDVFPGFQLETPQVADESGEIRLADGVFEGTGDGPQRDIRVIGQAPRPQDGATTGLDPIQYLGDQPSLADSRLPDHEECPSALVPVAHVLPGVDEHLPLGVASHQAALSVSLRFEARSGVPGPLDDEDLDRAADAFQFPQTERVHDEVGVD